MSVETSAFQPSLPRELFDSARHQVNEWRGRCLDSFARAETAITECLMHLSEVPERGSQIRLPHLVGQRYDALAIAIGEGGPFETEGANIVAALAAFRAHDDLRAHLCHGKGEILLDRNGHWTLILRTLTLRARRASQNLRVFREAETENLWEALNRASHILCSHLGQLKAKPLK